MANPTLPLRRTPTRPRPSAGAIAWRGASGGRKPSPGKRSLVLAARPGLAIMAPRPSAHPRGQTVRAGLNQASSLVQGKADSGAAAVSRVERDAGLAQLLHAAAAGSASAFEAFYDATIGYAQALGRRMVRPADLEDLLAEVFFQAWREAARFDAQRGSAVTWLLTLVRSRALDLLRHQRASPEVEAMGDPPEIAGDGLGPDELMSGMQSGGRLHGALAQLSSNERWVLGLAYYRELSHREICEQTGLPLGTVKSLILRAQAKLREQLATTR